MLAKPALDGGSGTNQFLSDEAAGICAKSQRIKGEQQCEAFLVVDADDCQEHERVMSARIVCQPLSKWAVNESSRMGHCKTVRGLNSPDEQATLEQSSMNRRDNIELPNLLA